MWLPRLRFTVRSMLVAAAIAACAVGSALAFAVEPPTAESVLIGWASLYAIPSVLILGRNVPLRFAVRVAGRITLLGAPAACLYGLLSFAMSGYVGLVGAFAVVTLTVGWLALLAAAFPSVASYISSMFDVGSAAE